MLDFKIMKILRHNPETVTVENNGSVLIYNLDELRRKAIYDSNLSEILKLYVKFKIEERR